MVGLSSFRLEIQVEIPGPINAHYLKKCEFNVSVKGPWSFAGKHVFIFLSGTDCSASFDQVFCSEICPLHAYKLYTVELIQ